MKTLKAGQTSDQVTLLASVASLLSLFALTEHGKFFFAFLSSWISYGPLRDGAFNAVLGGFENIAFHNGASGSAEDFLRTSCALLLVLGLLIAYCLHRRWNLAQITLVLTAPVSWASGFEVEVLAPLFVLALAVFAVGKQLTGKRVSGTEKG